MSLGPPRRCPKPWASRQRALFAPLRLRNEVRARARDKAPSPRCTLRPRDSGTRVAATPRRDRGLHRHGQGSGSVWGDGDGAGWVSLVLGGHPRCRVTPRYMCCAWEGTGGCLLWGPGAVWALLGAGSIRCQHPWVHLPALCAPRGAAGRLCKPCGRGCHLLELPSSLCAQWAQHDAHGTPPARLRPVPAPGAAEQRPRCCN